MIACTRAVMDENKFAVRGGEGCLILNSNVSKSWLLLFKSVWNAYSLTWIKDIVRGRA